MSLYDEDQDERMRYGYDADLCPACRESLTGRCRFHRELELEEIPGYEKSCALCRFVEAPCIFHGQLARTWPELFERPAIRRPDGELAETKPITETPQ